MSDTAGSVDERLAALFDPRPEVADARYRDLLHRLTKFFEWRQCLSPEDLAQEVLVRGLRRLGEGLVLDNDPTHYFFGIAKHVVQEDRRSAARQPEPMPIDGLIDERGISPAEARICLSQVLSRMSPAERWLLWHYHFGDRDALQRDLGVSAKTLRVRVHRLQRRVKQEVRQVVAARQSVK